MSDRILGALALLVAVAMFWAATGLKEGFVSDPLGAKGFPILVAVVLGAAALYPLARPDPEPDWPARGPLIEIAIAVVVMLAYVYALPIVGFLASTAVASAVLCWRLRCGPLEAAIAGVAISVGIYLTFHTVLGLGLAKGPWGF